MYNILCNKIQTPDGTILESKHRHDMVSHKDKNGKVYSTDGGTDYLKRSGSNDYIDLSIYDIDDHEKIRNNIKYTNKLIKDLSVSEIKHIIEGNISDVYKNIFNDELKFRKCSKNIPRIKTINELKQLCYDLRNFDANSVLTSKLNKINEFFTSENLDSVVVGLSGGIDSSVVFKLLLEASNITNSPIKQVLGVFMPIYSPGTTGQDIAEKCVNNLLNSCKHYSAMKYKKLDLSHASMSYRQVIGTTTNWHIGQIDSIVRTPALYGLAAKLQNVGYKSIVCGTTNRDEGAYIGFYGKASDGMNDLQPIADLHKSEVEQIAELLLLPYQIILRPPTGDVHDGKTDEDMIGCPYWFLEIYQILIENDATYLISYIKDCEDILKWCTNIEILHNKNKHKYKVGSPSRYIDVMKRDLFLL